MRINVRFNPNTFIEYVFELEADNWKELFEKVKAHADEFDSAHREVFGEPTLLDRIRERIAGP